jgi:hypothetical protein
MVIARLPPLATIILEGHVIPPIETPVSDLQQRVYQLRKALKLDPRLPI